MKQYFTLNFILIVFIAFTSCHSSTKKNNMAALDKQGHRGCRGLMPENTIAAMLQAIDLGVTTLEMDVVITNDSQVILSHEPFFNHEISTKPNGDSVTLDEEKTLNIYQMNYSEVAKFDVGMRKHPRFLQQKKIPAIKPKLQDIFDAVKIHCAKMNKALPFFNIETKTMPATDDLYHPKFKPFVDLLLAVIDQNKLADKVTIQSFDIRTLQYLHGIKPNISTALLIEENDEMNSSSNIAKLGFVPSIYSPHFSHVTDSLIAACHAQHVKVIPWTVNDAATIKNLTTLGVDGIITDYPNLF